MLGHHARRTTDLRARRHEQTRREILEAAWALAEEHGIAGLSLREVARAVGMRAPSLYTYFPSKDAIYDAMFAEGYRALLELYRDLEHTAEPSERRTILVGAVERFVTFCQESPARYQLMFTRAVPGWEPAPEAYAVSLDSYGQMTASLARLGISGDRALDLFTAVSAGLAGQQLANDPSGDRWRRLAGPAVEMLVDHLDRWEGERP